MATINLYPHQVENAHALVDAVEQRGAALDCSETGTGKSFTALAVCKVLNRKPFVICPLSVGPAWDIKFKQAGIRGGRWINYEKARRSNFKMPDNHQWVLIFDECHRCKSPQSQQAKMLARLAPKYPSLLLSATPFSTPLETRALLHVLGIRDWQRWYSLLPQLGCFQNRNLHNAWMWKGRDEDIENLHKIINPYTVKTKWSEIGYHYVIERDPLLLRVGRRSDRAGAHCKGANRNSLGIVIVGNFEEETLDRQTLCFAAQAVADLCVSYGLTASDVYGHNHAPGGTTATVCPGFSMDDLRARVSEILSKG